MTMLDTYYAFPEAAYAFILLVPILALFWSLWQYRHLIINRFADSDVRQTVIIPRPNSIYIGKVITLSFVWICTTLALMQPISYGRYPEELAQSASKPEQLSGRQRQPHSVIMLLDASASMSVADMRTGQTRLDYAKELASGIVNRLDGQSVALEAFTSEVTPLSPLTTSYIFVYTMAKQIQINEGGVPGTDLLDTLKNIRERYFPIPNDLQKTLVLMTDGEDTTIEFAGSEKQKDSNAILDQVADAEKNQLRVITVGLGTKQGKAILNIVFNGNPVISTLNEELLQQLSNKGRGKYYFADSYASINLAEEIVKEIKQQEKGSSSGEEASQKITGEQDNLIHYRYFQIPLGIAIILLLGILLLPDRLRKLKDKGT